MTAGVEAPVQAPVLQLVDGQAALLDGLIAEISQWTVLDAHLWPFDRDHGSKSSSGEVARGPNLAPIRMRTGLTDTHDSSPAICDVVAAWRTADRELAGLVENEPEWNRVRAEIIGLRALHHRLFEARLGSRQGIG
jgi:hypothetical protein